MSQFFAFIFEFYYFLEGKDFDWSYYLHCAGNMAKAYLSENNSFLALMIKDKGHKYFFNVAK
jgi:hypothetical protein